LKCYDHQQGEGEDMAIIFETLWDVILMLIWAIAVWCIGIYFGWVWIKKEVRSK